LTEYLFVSSIAPRVLIVKDIFTLDWYNGTPADYPLMTEVDPAGGFVEITYPGTGTADVGGWTLATSGGEWRLPARLPLQAGKPLVLVRSKADFTARYGAVPNVVELPGLALQAAKGLVELRRDGRRIDLVAWGGAEPGWKLAAPSGADYCRPDPGRDTNTYLDWSTGRPSPGVPGCATP
jgi:hypothetical protein